MWLSVDTELAQEKTASVGGGREATGARRPRGQLSRGGEGGGSWLSQTPEEPLRGATFRAAAASLEAVCAETNISPLRPPHPPLLSAAWCPQAALETCAPPGHSPARQRWGLRLELKERQTGSIEGHARSELGRATRVSLP